MSKLSLKDARYQYRNKNKSCKYCEFSYMQQELELDYIFANYIDVLYCKLSEKQMCKVCEFYQVKED
ncbi:MAG: hypothetical protein E6356_13800 [Terrisporobacter othiniensis]|nr:hypothetical protein [Terrisporobacter othiniensis]